MTGVSSSGQVTAAVDWFNAAWNAHYLDAAPAWQARTACSSQPFRQPMANAVPAGRPSAPPGSPSSTTSTATSP
jgi:hypothetical protein